MKLGLVINHAEDANTGADHLIIHLTPQNPAAVQRLAAAAQHFRGF